MLIITIQIFSLCWQFFPCVRTKFPMFSLSGKSKNQILCFLCAVATLDLVTGIQSRPSAPVDRHTPVKKTLSPPYGRQ